MSADQGYPVETGVPSRVDTMLQRVAERLGASARVETIFGQPIERDGVTVVPVAKASWGFGGGAGSGTDQGEGSGGGGGGGGGLHVTPVGYIELKDGRSRFRRIVDPTTTSVIVIASSMACLLVLREARKLVRAGR